MMAVMGQKGPARWLSNNSQNLNQELFMFRFYADYRQYIDKFSAGFPMCFP
jgi:hypothetical protein